MRHRRLSWNFRISLTAGNWNLDANERFAVRNCAVYLLRHLRRFPVFDRETLEMIFWVLGERSDGLGRFFRQCHLVADDDDAYEVEMAMKKLVETDSFEDYASAVEDLLPFVSRADLRGVVKKVIELLEERARVLEDTTPCDIEKKLRQLQKMFNLNRKEYQACVLLFINSIFDKPESFFVSHLGCNSAKGKKYLCNILAFSLSDYHKVFYGTIRKVGLLDMDRVDLKIENDFLEMLLDPQGLRQNRFFRRAEKSDTRLEDHFVSPEQRDHLARLLAEKNDTPTHILLYGSPGTGKTSFARAIAAKTGVRTCEITPGDEDNRSENRRAAITACLNLANSGDGCIVIVDEADALLNTAFSFFFRGETQDKGWLNNLLDQPGTRFIWITNSIDLIEDSIVRRFAYSLHFRSFTRKQLAVLWENVLRKNRVKRFFPKEDIALLAADYRVNAGVIDMAVKKARDAGAKSAAEFNTLVRLSLDAHQTLLNHGVPVYRREGVDRDYSLEGLNIAGDLEEMLTRIERFDAYLKGGADEPGLNFNLLFYGPPGTGKSELARYLARRLDRGLVVKRGSDILDKYVGGTEARISRAFAEAEAEGDILVFDEVDTLLRGRDFAARSWESSMVNEFLCGMERFRGIMVCTTNRLDDLDPACLRRFAVKTAFDFLTPRGNRIFFNRSLARLCSAPLTAREEEELAAITGLAPGDFNTVRNRFRFSPREEVGAAVLIRALQEEAGVKELHGGRKIGFA